MLDKYYFGKVERISPEAPVPVVNIVTEESRLGGASNVANNISSLGGNAFLCGAIGHDFFGKEIERMARQKNIRTSFIKTVEPTIAKARVIGGRQQIVRIDYEQKLNISDENFLQLKKQVSEFMKTTNLLVISDYGKGLISKEVCSFLIQKAKEYRMQVIIDPKGQDWEKYVGADLITPNVKELGDILGKNITNTDKEIEVAGQVILQRYGLAGLLVTRSEKGMSLIRQDEVIHIPTYSQEVFDVSGAGDTVVATLALALSAGKEIKEAIHVANVAAGIVVTKLGTATLHIDELNKNLDKDSSPC